VSRLVALCAIISIQILSWPLILNVVTSYASGVGEVIITPDLDGVDFKHIFDTVMEPPAGCSLPLPFFDLVSACVYYIYLLVKGDILSWESDIHNRSLVRTK
jgi:hypothetical protein